MNPEDLDALSSENQISAAKVPADISPSGTELENSAKALSAAIRSAAQQHEGNVSGLLSLLRLLESLHREIEDGLFRQALPTNRQQLYALLRDMETQGGWPYIPRLRLKQIMHWIEELEEPDEEPTDLI